MVMQYTYSKSEVARGKSQILKYKSIFR